MTSDRLLELVWLMLPVYCANMAAPFVKFWRGWNRPIHPLLLGNHKTIVGFGVGVAAAIAAAYLQSGLLVAIPLLWDARDWLGVGFACGLGALCGDAVKSFFKRRLGIAPGHRWIPADQVDFVVGGLLALGWFVNLSGSDILAILAVSFVADVAVNQLAFRAGIRDTAW